MSIPNRKIHPAPEGFYWDLSYTPIGTYIDLRRKTWRRLLGVEGTLMGSFPFSEPDWEKHSAEVVDYVLCLEQQRGLDPRVAKRILREAIGR